ncbi:hypothetical protein CUJ86_08475 [Methanofollis fontis]|uniref:Uncharacterized protein n=2 Tax=Methanofollis fontis TaxID=2052832 RepID=A0A483CS18_9EURY|nr:hypothetical protein CUJ86_08475 [Methanofollis fontis]
MLHAGKISREHIIKLEKCVTGTQNTLEKCVPGTHNEHIPKVSAATIFFSTPDFIRVSGIPKESGTKILKELADNGIVDILQQGKGRKPNIYAFYRLMAISEGGRL